MKYLLSSLIISATLLLVGCIATQPVNDANTNVNQADSAGVTNTAAETNSNDSTTSTATTNSNETTTVDETVNADEAATVDETDTAEDTNEDVAIDVDTSDWLTYTNEEYGFSFRYPDNLVYVESKEGDVEGLGYLQSIKDGNKNFTVIMKVDNVGLDYFQSKGDTEAHILSQEMTQINGTTVLIEVGENTLSQSESSDYYSYMFSLASDKTLTLFFDNVQLDNIQEIKLVVLSLNF